MTCDICGDTIWPTGICCDILIADLDDEPTISRSTD